MSVLEIVHVRVASGEPHALAALLRESLGGEVGARVRISREGLDTDLAVHIQHHAGLPSELGLRIADALRERGLVLHTTWRSLPVP